MVDVVTSINDLNKTSMALILGIKGLTAAFGSMKKGIEFFDKTQKEAIKFGLDAKQVQNRLGDSIDSLNGSIDRKLNTSIATLNAGINGNIEGVNTLINEQQILGQTYKKTATIFAKLEATAGFNNTQLGDLAVVVDKNRLQYNRSTEFLVDSLEQVSDQFTSLSLQEGLADPVIGAYTELTGMLGPSLGNSLSMAFKTLISPEFDTISKRALLGIPEFGDFLFNLRDSEQGIAGFRKAFITAKDTIMQFTGGVYSREVIRNVFGPGGEAIVNVARALEDLTDDQIKEYEQQAQTNQLFSVALEQIFDPLKQLVINAAPGLGAVAESLSDTIKNITGDKGLHAALTDTAIKIVEFTETFGTGLMKLLSDLDYFIPGTGLGIYKNRNKEIDKLPEDMKNVYRAAITGSSSNVDEATMRIISGMVKEGLTEEERVRKILKTVTNPFSDNYIEGFDIDKLFPESAKVDLSDIKESLEKSRKRGQDLEKENQRKLDEILGETKRTADNTADLVDAMTDTTSQFFQETGDIFARSAAAILGFTPDSRNYQEELVDLTTIIAEKTGQVPFWTVAEGGQ
jgi:hypothetical protein